MQQFTLTTHRKTAIMADATGKETRITDQSYRKSNDAIGLRVREGRLSLLSRKILNVMMLHAQQQGAPGKNVPAELKTEASAQYYWIPMSIVKRDTRYDSRDTDLLKAAVEEMQNVRIEFEDDQAWTSERLLSGVKIANTAGLRSKGGTVWFGYTFPPEVTSQVLNPTTYTRLSLYYQSILNTGGAVSLYEICRRFATSPGQLTSRNAWNWWYYALTGNPTNEPPPPYKYFKRDVLNPAIRDVNAQTDVEIELIEHKQGRKVEDLQFGVHLKDQPLLELVPKPVIDGAMVMRLVAHGFLQGEATELVINTELSKLQAAVAYLETRMANKKLPPVEHPAAFLRSALAKGWADAVPAATEEKANEAPQPKVRGKKPSLRERFAEHRRGEASEMYGELNDGEQVKLLNNWRTTLSTTDAKILKGGVDKPMVRVAFFDWLAIETWGPITDAAVLEFADQQ